jgi:hypothetical protein
MIINTLKQKKYGICMFVSFMINSYKKYSLFSSAVWPKGDS